MIMLIVGRENLFHGTHLQYITQAMPSKKFVVYQLGHVLRQVRHYQSQKQSQKLLPQQQILFDDR